MVKGRGGPKGSPLFLTLVKLKLKVHDNISQESGVVNELINYFFP